jgi:hypothetical protein
VCHTALARAFRMPVNCDYWVNPYTPLTTAVCASRDRPSGAEHNGRGADRMRLITARSMTCVCARTCIALLPSYSSCLCYCLIVFYPFRCQLVVLILSFLLRRLTSRYFPVCRQSRCLVISSMTAFLGKRLTAETTLDRCHPVT